MIIIIGRFFTDTIPSMEMEEEVWKQLCNAYNVDKLILVDSPHTLKLSNRGGYTQYSTMEEALSNTMGQKIFLQPPLTVTENNLSNVLMRDFVFPEDIVLIFGVSFDNNVRYIEETDTVLSIVLPNDNRGVCGMNICAMVLRDRWLKSE